MPGFFDKGEGAWLIGTNIGIVDQEIVPYSATNHDKVTLVGATFASDGSPVDGHADHVTLIKVSEECGEVGGLESKEVFGPHGLDHPVKTGDVDIFDLVCIVLLKPALELVGVFGS